MNTAARQPNNQSVTKEMTHVGRDETGSIISLIPLRSEQLQSRKAKAVS